MHAQLKPLPKAIRPAAQQAEVISFFDAVRHRLGDRGYREFRVAEQALLREAHDAIQKLRAELSADLDTYWQYLDGEMERIKEELKANDPEVAARDVLEETKQKNLQLLLDSDGSEAEQWLYKQRECAAMDAYKAAIEKRNAKLDEKKRKIFEIYHSRVGAGTKRYKSQLIGIWDGYQRRVAELFNRMVKA